MNSQSNSGVHSTQFFQLFSLTMLTTFGILNSYPDFLAEVTLRTETTVQYDSDLG